MLTNKNLRITVLGVGGCGTNSVNSFAKENMENVLVYAINTDNQQFEKLEMKSKVLIGSNITKGIGCGGDPEKGKQCALNDSYKLEELVKNSDIVVITAGMGGGTGTGVSPIIAQLAKNHDALVISIVTKPFNFEGESRIKKAEFGISELEKYSDSLVVISNDRIMFSQGEKSLQDAFRSSDNVLLDSIKTILAVMNSNGIINLDFADIKNSLKDKGLTMITKAYAKGENKLLECAKKCSQSTLLDYSLRNAQTVIMNVKASSDINLDDIDKCVSYLRNYSKTSLNVLFGFEEDKYLHDELFLYLIATDYIKKEDDSINELSRVNLNIDMHSVNENDLLDESKFDVLDIVPEFLKQIKKK